MSSAGPIVDSGQKVGRFTHVIDHQVKEEFVAARALLDQPEQVRFIALPTGNGVTEDDRVRCDPGHSVLLDQATEFSRCNQ
jgi:hypothetical protein